MTQFILLFGLGLSPLAYAAPGQHGAGLGVGEVLLMGDFSKNFANSLGFDLMYSYEASPLFGLLTHLTMSNHSDASGNNTLGIKGITPDLKINLAYIDKLALYSATGFGLFKIDETLGAISASVLTLGFNLGVGFNLALDTHFQFGTSLSFWNIFGKTDQATVTTANPQGLSVGGTYLDVLVSLMYYF